MPSQTWVARFVVDHGRVTEEGGRLRTFQRRRLDEPEIDLHVLAEPSGPKADEFGSQALEAIGRDFVKDSLSLTGGLLRALSATNQVLLDWNRRSIAREQVAVGVTAAVLRGAVVYLAQAGPGVVFWRQGGKLVRLAAEGDAAVSLGEGSIEPELRRVELQPGDVLIAASPAIETLMDQEALEALLERGTDVALPEIYLSTRDQENFALFAITCLEEPATQAEEDVPESRTEPEPEPEAEAEPSPSDPLAMAEQDQPEPRPGAPALPEGTRLTFEQAAADGADPSGPALVAPKPIDISRPVVRLRNDQFSGRVDYPRTAAGSRPIRFQIPAARLIMIGAAAAVVLFIAAFTVPNLIHQNRQEQVAILLQRALTTYNGTTGELDPAKRRSLLEETRRLAAEALRIDSGNVQAAELRKQAGLALDILNNVIDLGPMQTLTTLGKQITGQVAIDDLVVAGGNAYMLDSRGRRIIMVPLSPPGAPVVVYSENASFGGSTARRPDFMAWDETGSRLLVLDSERKLFEVRATSVQQIGLRKTNVWSSVVDIAAYDGNLYILDPKGKQIYRYLPAANGFDSEPTALLPADTALSNAESLSVQEDLLVLTDDGTVRRFRAGTDATLPLSGIDQPLNSPSIIIAAADSELVFIADSGNKRIVVCNRDGVYQRQYIDNALTDVKAIAVAPGAGQLYAVVGDSLLTSPLPQ
jgi:hypothetical protein